ncbi:MAG: hypothetical protein F9K23_08425 [Bacteroidetes bacterium]|nr:MAG: hypothetical protein F9K23_08425 [Bacteroidota bacterium]
MKFFKWIIESIFWLMIFFSPVLIFTLISIFIYAENKDLIWFCLLLISIGVCLGILYAEKVRKKYGCSTYMGRLLRTPELEHKDGEDEKGSGQK